MWYKLADFPLIKQWATNLEAMLPFQVFVTNLIEKKQIV